jgi:hypothetical protein
MQSEKVVEQWSVEVLASEQIHYSITALVHHLWTANALLSRALRRFATFS